MVAAVCAKNSGPILFPHLGISIKEFQLVNEMKKVPLDNPFGWSAP
jgi:hypothetical protein